MSDAMEGRLGGPLADLAALVGERVGVFQLPIEYSLADGDGAVKVGDKVRASVTPYRSATGDVTTLRESIFSTIPGSPAWVGKATEHVVSIPEPGFEWQLEGRYAIQGVFHFSHE
jgi:hypothetical protein